MTTIQDGETHDEDMATGGYIAQWTDAVGLNTAQPAIAAPAGPPLIPGRWQTGDVHDDDVTRVIDEAPQWGKTGP